MTRVLGVDVAEVDRAAMLRLASELVEKGHNNPLAPPSIIAYANVHVLNTAYRDPALREFLNRAELCFCDGEGVRKAANFLGGAIVERMTGADWIWDLAALAEGRYRIFWLGGEPGVTDAAAGKLKARFPGLEVLCDHGFHPKEGPENDAVIARINAAKPDILLVGMGTPFQERWVAANRDRLRVPVVWVLGATADFISGKVSRGPAFLYNRYEWLARLLVDPRRLWRRYLVGNVLFVERVVRQKALS